MKTGGNCFGVVADPQAAGTLWAATGWWEHNAGDVCRSDDDGRTWRAVGEPKSGLPDAQVLEMALDPASPVGRRRLVVASKGHGLFETRDGGESWHDLNGDLPDIEAAPGGLLLDPSEPRHLVAALGRQLYETRDGGRTWQRLNAPDAFGEITALAAAPRDFRTLYLTAREHYDPQAQQLHPGGAFRSADGGRTWERILDDRFADGIAISPADPRVLYAATADHPYHDNPITAGLLKSRDGGRTWRRENTGLTLLNTRGICISPHDPATLFLGTLGNGVFAGRDAAPRSR